MISQNDMEYLKDMVERGATTAKMTTTETMPRRARR